MALKKNKVKGPIFTVEISCGTLGTQVLFVYKVTEKVICVAHNELGVSYYNRETGYEKETVTGLAAVARWHMNTGLLEEALKKYGKKSIARYVRNEVKTDENGRFVLERGRCVYEKVVEEKEVYVYDSGWNPAINSKEEVVRDVPPLNDFNSNKVSWFIAQGYKVIKAR